MQVGGEKELGGGGGRGAWLDGAPMLMGTGMDGCAENDRYLEMTGDMFCEYKRMNGRDKGIGG